MTVARTVAEVIAGEAVSGTHQERWDDMVSIASAIQNRANLLGVTPQEVVGIKKEFNAFDTPLPQGVGQNLVGLAQAAMDHVAENGPVHPGTFYATPNAVKGLPDKLSFEMSTAGHEFYSDPYNRAIETAAGWKTPSAFAYAANPANVPTPAINPSAIPTQNPAYLAGAQLQDVDPNLALAVPDPISNLPAPDLATAQNFEKPAPAVNSWSDMAAAKPMTAPMDSVTAKGLFAAVPGLEASTSVQAAGVMPGLQSDGFSQVAAAGPMGGDYAAPADRFGPQPSIAAPEISQADVARGLFNVTADGQMDPAFTEAMMSPQNPVVPTAVETSSYAPETVDNARFTTVAEAAPKTSRIGEDPAFDAARMPGLVDPVTNTAGFTPQPADLGSFPAAVTAQRGPTSGIFSAEMQAMQGHVTYEAQKAEQERQAAMLAANPAMATPNFSQALNPSVPALASTPVDLTASQAAEVDQASRIPGVIAAKTAPASVMSYVDEAAKPPAVAAIEAQTNVPAAATPTSSALLSPTPIASMNPTLTPAVSKGLFAGVPVDQVNQAGFVPELSPNPEINLSGQIVPGAQAEELAPDLEAITVPDQPAITKTQVDIPGPATQTPVEQQQVTAAKKTAAQPTPQTTAKRGFWDSLISPQTAIGATVGGLAAGPIGGIFGAIAGQQVAQNPGMFSAEPMQINTISGPDAVTSIWGGGQPVGTQATASDGQTVTAMSGGRTAITNAHGVTTVFDSNGKAMAYHGSDLDKDQDQSTASTNSGGIFSGLFG